MKKLLLPLILLAVLAGGFFGGTALRSPQDEAVEETDAEVSEIPQAHDAETLYEYVKLDRQFVVPILEGSTIISLVVADIQLEVTPGSSEFTFFKMPKLRDAFLRVFYRHSHTGSLKNLLFSDRMLIELRDDLEYEARAVLGDRVNDVLITDIIRQDQ